MSIGAVGLTPLEIVGLAGTLAMAVAAVLVWRVGRARRRRAEDHYRRLYEGERAVVTRLREVEETKNQLLAVVSHEFRTPLTGVLGYARTMQARLDDLDRDRVRAFLHYIDRQSTRLSLLVDNLVAAADTSAVDQQAVTNLGRATARAGLELAQHGGVRDQRLSISIPGELEVPMGAEATGRVLFNLLDNAVKFGTPGTEVRVEAWHDRGEVVVDVTNIGPPIAGELRERMFDRFEQGDSSDSRAVDGMGLGLHVVRRLVDSHSGTVELHDRDGMVVFRVRFPDPSRMAVRPPLRSAG